MRLPGRNYAFDPDGYAYVLEFSNGVIKVGQTKAPLVRVRQHELKAQAVGVSLMRTWVSPLHRAYSRTEKALIAAAEQSGELAQGAEYFVGCDFDALVQVALAVDLRESAPEIRARVAEARRNKRATSGQLLANHLLGGNLDNFIGERRRKGLSWRRISSELFHASDGAIDVTAGTLNDWFGQASEVAA